MLCLSVLSFDCPCLISILFPDDRHQCVPWDEGFSRGLSWWLLQFSLWSLLCESLALSPSYLLGWSEHWVRSHSRGSSCDRVSSSQRSPNRSPSIPDLDILSFLENGLSVSKSSIFTGKVRDLTYLFLLCVFFWSVWFISCHELGRSITSSAKAT